VEIVLDLRAVGHREAQRMEQRLDPLPRARDRVQGAHGLTAAGQRDVERVGRELAREPTLGQLLAPALQRGFQLRLRLVDPRAGGRTLAGGQPAEVFRSSVSRPPLPRYLALTFSSATASSQPANSDPAAATMDSSSCIARKKKGRRSRPPSLV
jgi:hypothetical protein